MVRVRKATTARLREREKGEQKRQTECDRECMENEIEIEKKIGEMQSKRTRIIRKSLCEIVFRSILSCVRINETV